MQSERRKEGSRKGPVEGGKKLAIASEIGRKKGKASKSVAWRGNRRASITSGGSE